MTKVKIPSETTNIENICDVMTDKATPKDHKVTKEAVQSFGHEKNKESDKNLKIIDK